VLVLVLVERRARTREAMLVLDDDDGVGRVGIWLVG